MELCGKLLHTKTWCLIRVCDRVVSHNICLHFVYLPVKMGKDQDFIQAVKDNDQATLQRLLQKAEKSGKSKYYF